MIRSLGGWTEVKRGSLRGRDHVMSDERILGDSDFVDSIISQSGEHYERRYELKRQGFDLDCIAGVGCAVERGELIAKKRNFMLITDLLNY